MRQIVCVGDSVTAGQYVRAAQRWTSILQERHPELVITNKGVCSDTTRLALERFPQDVQAHEPHTVIIQFGHNDANSWESDRGLPRVSPAAYQANLMEMAARCVTFGVRRVIVAVPYPCDSPKVAVRLGDYRERARFVARTFEPPANLDLLADGLHLSPLGHQQYAAALEPLL